MTNTGIIEMVTLVVTAAAMLVSVFLSTRELKENRNSRAPFFAFIGYTVQTSLPRNIHPEETSTAASLGNHHFHVTLKNVGIEPATECIAVFAILNIDNFRPYFFHGDSVSSLCLATDIPGEKELVITGNYTFSTIYADESTSLGSPGWLAVYVSYRMRSKGKKRIQAFVRRWDGTSLSGKASEIEPVMSRKIINKAVRAISSIVYKREKELGRPK